MMLDIPIAQLEAINEQVTTFSSLIQLRSLTVAIVDNGG